MADQITEPVTSGASHIRTFAKDAASLSGKPLPKPAPVTTPAPEPVRLVPPAPITPTIPAALPVDKEKEAAIARLKAKVVLPSSPLPPEPVAPLPPLMKDAPVANAPIHTYKTDFAEHVQDKGASRISVLAAQQDAQTQAPVILKEKKRSALPIVLLSLFLIVGGVGGVYVAYHFATREVAPSDLFIPSLIFADERVALSGSGQELRQGLAAAKGNEPLSDGGVLVAYITYATTTDKGTVEVPATGGELFAALQLPAPDILLRNVADESTVGAVRAGGEERPFFLLRVDSYERTYAGMLAWEPTMERDLTVFYPAYPSEATTTPATEDPFRVSFVDDIVDNHDVRVLRDGEGKTLMLYGYRDKDTLVIARNEAAFSELLNRLAATRAQ